MSDASERRSACEAIDEAAKGEDIGEELREWRERVPWSLLSQTLRAPAIAKLMLFSCVVLAAGGLLDTAAAVRSGFFPICGTEK